METRLVSFRAADDGTLYEPIQSGTPRSIDDFRIDGWEPIHWDLVGRAPTSYLVVMQREQLEGGDGSYEQLLHQSKALRQ